MGNGIRSMDKLAVNMEETKGVAVLGATGSIGTQALEVIRAHSDLFSVKVLTGQNNADLLIRQALEFRPEVVVIGDETRNKDVVKALAGTGVEVQCGKTMLGEAVQRESVDVVLTALVGSAGLEPTILAIQAGKDIALANKETLVVGGSLVMDLAQRHGVNLLPVDSEHSAIFQCLAGEDGRRV